MEQPEKALLAGATSHEMERPGPWQQYLIQCILSSQHPASFTVFSLLFFFVLATEGVFFCPRNQRWYALVLANKGCHIFYDYLVFFVLNTEYGNLCPGHQSFFLYCLPKVVFLS